MNPWRVCSASTACSIHASHPPTCTAIDLPTLLMRQAAGEHAVRQAFAEATIFKLAHLVGVEDRLFNTYAQVAKRLPFMPLIDDGANRIQPVYVRDVADAMVGSLNGRSAQGKTFHLAGPEVFTCATQPQAPCSTRCPAFTAWLG